MATLQYGYTLTQHTLATGTRKLASNSSYSGRALSIASLSRPRHQSIRCASASPESPSGNSEVQSSSSSTVEPSVDVVATQSEASKTVFVVGATGATGKKIVKQLVGKGYKVRAGVRDLEKAKNVFGANPGADLEFVYTDVTLGTEKLKLAIGQVDAVVVATGFTPGFDLTSAWKVDNLGTVSVVDAALSLGIPKFVLVSSLLTNGAAAGQILNRSYLILNLFGLVLIAKLQAENYIRQSGIDYTIVRPGGLRNDPPAGNLVLSSEDTLFEGSISRDTVAEVAVESLFSDDARYKVFEIVSKADAPKKSLLELFQSVKSK